MRSRDPEGRPSAPAVGSVRANESSGTVCGLVLAAGAGRRFGSAKQLSRLANRPLLEHALAAMAEASVARFAVVLGASAAEILAEADLHGGQPIVCRDWESGQAASLRAGVEALADAEAVIVTLGDQPLISAQAINRVAENRSSAAEGVRASYGGRPGHPVLLERPLLDGVPGLRGDTGARELLAGAELVTIPCEDVAEPTDVDTPSRLSQLNARLAKPGPEGGART